MRKNAGSGSALNQCGSTTLASIFSSRVTQNLNEERTSPGAAAVAAARPLLLPLPPDGGAEHPAPAAAAAAGAREEAGQRGRPVI
jgi:hypothetical protein